MSLVDVVHDAASRPRRVPVDVVIGSTGVPPVAGDESAVRRAVDHVVANAARHATGTVRITVGSVDGEVRVDVDDDGPGIPVHQRSEVVRRFVRLDKGRDRDAGGAGLGLAVSADVARAHGGYLRIADSPLGGARVTLTLPSGSPFVSPSRMNCELERRIPVRVAHSSRSAICRMLSPR